MKFEKGSVFDIFLVLEDSSLKRIKEYDPGELNLPKMGAPWDKMTLRNIHILYATEEEAKNLVAAKGLTEMWKQIKHLARGWKFLPEAGDSDEPFYENVARKN